MDEISEAVLTFQDRTLLEVLPCYVFLQCGGDITYANRIAREALALEAGAAGPVEQVFEGAFPGLAYGRSGCDPARRENVLGSATQPYTTEFECHLRTPGGSLLPVHGSFRVLQADPEIRLLIIAMRGSHAAATGETSNFLEQLLNAAPEAIMITRGARILHVNREFERLFGFSAEEALGRNTYDLLIPETRRHEFGMLEHTIHLYGRASMETARLNKAGELIDVSLLVAPIELSGVVVGNFVSYRDIRDKKRTDSRLQYDAMHDSLTGLANRNLFLDRMQLVMARRGRRQDLQFAVMFLDLDRFKTVNDSFGHAYGDELLMKIATLLQACFRPEDTLARFGGDEFAVLMEDVAGISDAVRIAERVQNDIRLPVEIYGNEVVVTASIGIAFAATDHTSPEQVLRGAEYAMYQAKSRGNAHHEIFDGFTHVLAAERGEKVGD
jgi:diguanylate cyclase (GGDEF)-like protein/PAS domain S-box-containing protein